MSQYSDLKQDLIALHGLFQQRQQLHEQINQLDALSEEIATRILNEPNTPTECFVQLDAATIAWIEHSDNWNQDQLRDAIEFHSIRCLK